MRLSELSAGQRARVVAVDSQGEVGQRILEMGVTPGIIMRLVGTAPLGDPLAFEVRGYRLSLRRAEAALVEVERL
ncbi:MAG: ferrous iron transport protein A [Planctomycetaceae bacterium]|nr:ferrous iron transport protein A [Planctomycetaceae bacterium]MBV8269090.1 ferrous iron transport protein A [Planctomycetaceae bacterium]MBV8318028.1 ferrous iron transport protein A [Planctomycetaceae bacterium]MBV8382216.1 ferrous iron transport protein A [Planctomycetaceae bacterium]MBV8558153.1 ferrous iron transport protein A [Planctomycetaceae bacterium]